MMRMMYPLGKAAIMSCGMMTVSDGLSQTLTKKEGDSLDLQRTARFSLVGLSLHAPMFFYGFKAMDRVFGNSRSIPLVLAKTAAVQVAIWPAYLAALFTYSAILEGESLKQGLTRSWEMLPNAYAASSSYWPVVNALNFMFVPTAQRLLVAQAAGVVWNTYLCAFANQEAVCLSPEELAIKKQQLLLQKQSEWSAKLIGPHADRLLQFDWTDTLNPQ